MKSGPRSFEERLSEISCSDLTVRSTLSRLKVSGWVQVILFCAMFSMERTEFLESMMPSITASKPALPSLFLNWLESSLLRSMSTNDV